MVSASGRTRWTFRKSRQELKAIGLYESAVDGAYGMRTDEAIQALFQNQGVTDFDDWPDRRRTIAAGQVFCRMDGIEVGRIDGLMGPQTATAFEIYAARKANGGKPDPKVESWQDQAAEQPAPPPSHPLPPPSAGAPASKPVWPRQSGVQAFFGTPGSNQVTLILPFPMRIAWDTSKSVSKWSCNKKCRESFERIWKRTLDHYGIDEIKRLRLDLWGGTLNVRKMRGGSSWSMHAYGIAQDVDPERNQLKWGRDKASLDDPAYDAFWSFVYDEGAIALGRERNYDWMHFQFALL